MLARIKQWLFPRRVTDAPETEAFHARMHDARLYGLTQRRESQRRRRVQSLRDRVTVAPRERIS